MNSIGYFVVSMILAISQSVMAQDSNEDGVKYLQQQWAVSNYQLQGKEQEEAFVTLLADADKMVEASPNEAPVLIWRAIIESTYAGIKGGIGALKWVKAARADLEQAISLDDQALQGSAYTSLGTLYYKVPGWPIGFGDDDKAESLLKKALDINPAGIDPNYFYGEFLLNEKRYQESQVYFMKALDASPRPGREVADRGRKEEVEKALKEVQKHLS